MTDDNDTDDDSTDIEELAEAVQKLDHTVSQVILEQVQGDREPDELIERTDTGVSIQTTMKRGTGTRDQDEHRIKAKGHTVEDALDKLDRSVDGLEEREYFQQVRDYQPEADGEDDGS